ncbi:MAG TPA: 16S rRNA (cytidine(1402)-2'-O)-methyltransferase [Allosphingosinicella sp.]|jgi:16S rRNA (cytidine1402-2'-O)-methyltransferase
MVQASPGTLYLVATPIGNLEDLSYRAVRILGEVDAIAAEDTRHCRKLLDHYAIRPKRLFACHDHNERASAQGIAVLLREGKDVALVSDAGMPVINDPGYRVVEAAYAAQCPVRVLPGPSATLTALVLSNFSPHEFAFLGFAPRKEGKRRAWLERAQTLGMTIVLMEAPHRLPELLRDALSVLGDIRGAVCLELTKMFEETRVAPLSELVETYSEPPRGEVMVVLDCGGRPSARKRSNRYADKRTASS